MPAETGFSDDVMEMLVAYVDRDEGRRAPLSPDEEVMVRALLETNPTAQAQVDDLR